MVFPLVGVLRRDVVFCVNEQKSHGLEAHVYLEIAYYLD